MTDRAGAVERAHDKMDSGAFLDDLARRIAIPTESQVPSHAPELHRYQTDEIGPSFEAMGFERRIIENPVPERGPVLVAQRIEDPARPTVLIYGHGDVVRSVPEEWSDGIDPYVMKVDGDKVYGRGAVDNKGQHTLAMSAMQAVLEEREGALGFNAKFIIETGEEQGSPGLKQIVDENGELLAADMFLGFDGPRKSFGRMDLNLGCRGGVFFDLIVDLNRKGGLHSGHWGGVLPDAGIILAQAIRTITTPTGRILIEGWLPKSVPEAVLQACAELVVDPVPGTPEPDPDWGQSELSAREKTLAWTSFIVLAMVTGNPDNPVNAVPSYAKARCQIRYTVDVPRDAFVPALRAHLDEHGFKDVQIDTEIGRDQFPASRTDPDHPWVRWVRRSIMETTGVEPNVLPCSSGSNPSEMFKAGLDAPVIWMPHSYSGCNQHGADEHGLKSLFREGLGVVAGLYWDLGEKGTPEDA
jgi:acetylornithine deacetylase/succinyl-diaminopimelate desuccinylase-like protein